MRTERRAGVDGLPQGVRGLHRDAVAGKNLADHPRQVEIVFHDENARLFAGSAQHARQFRQQIVFVAEAS